MVFANAGAPVIRQDQHHVRREGRRAARPADCDDLGPTDGRMYGCIDYRACERRFDALLAKTATTRTAQVAANAVRAA
jgi:hypothetical protein